MTAAHCSPRVSERNGLPFLDSRTVGLIFSKTGGLTSLSSHSPPPLLLQQLACPPLPENGAHQEEPLTFPSRNLVDVTPRLSPKPLLPPPCPSVPWLLPKTLSLPPSLLPTAPVLHPSWLLACRVRMCSRSCHQKRNPSLLTEALSRDHGSPTEPAAGLWGDLSTA